MPDYNWKRFWCSREETFYLSDDGFLNDPDGELGKFFNRNLVSFESLINNQCLVLLGEPGIGKSYTIEGTFRSIKKNIEEEGDQTFWLNLNEYGSEDRLVRELFEDVAFTSWLYGKHKLYLFLDSLDECLLEINNLGALLISRFKRYPVDRLHLRIICRTADWKSSIENGLKEIWGKDLVDVYELAPLRKIDVIEAAKANLLNPDTFLEEIESKRVEPLAIKPITLEFLIRTYSKNKCFPETQEELYSKGCELLCGEPNESRRDAGHYGKFTVEQKMAVASRLATISVFSRHYAVWTNVDMGELPNEVFTISEACGGTENAGGKNFEIEEPIVKETLGTGLFSSRGPNLMGWAHQTFAEYLAAYYLKNHNLTLTQMISLITHPGDSTGKIVSSLEETAAWLAGMVPEVFNEIIKSEPTILLRCDLAKYDFKVRADLVESLLYQYDQKILMHNGHSLHSYFKKLNHPELAGQLRKYINDDTKTMDARDAAIDIAESCRLQSLLDDLIEIVLNVQQPELFRINAAYAIARIANDECKEKLKRLKPLALGDVVGDPNDEFKGCALQALWPSLLTAEELFEILTPPKTPNFLGAYGMFISGILRNHIWGDDIDIALNWAAKQERRKIEYSSLNELADSIMKQAWEQLDSQDVLELFAKALLSRLAFENRVINVDIFNKPASSQDSWVENDEKRRKTLRCMVNLLANDESKEMKRKKGYMLFGYPRMVFKRDFSWMIGCLKESTSVKEKKIWLDFIRRAFDYENVDQLSEIIKACKEENILYEEFATLLEPVLLDSPEAEKMKKDFFEWQEIENEEQEESSLEPSLSDEIANLLDAFDSGDLSAWWKLNRLLTIRNNSQYYGDELKSDLTKLPGWENADDITRTRIIKAARKYIMEQPSEPDKWLGTNNLYFPEFAAYRAILLQYHQSPNLLDSLPGNVWAKWAPIILAYPTPSGFGDEEVHFEMVKLAYQHAPEKINEVLLFLIEKENQESGNIWITYKMEKCWDANLLSLLELKIKDENLKSEAVGSLLKDLLKHKSFGARRHAEHILSLQIPPEGDDRKRAAIAAEMLIMYTHDAGWQSVWPIFQKDTDFGKEVISAVAHNFERRNTSIEDRLSDGQLTDL